MAKALRHLRDVEEVRRIPILKRRRGTQLLHCAIQVLRLLVDPVEQCQRVYAVETPAAFIEQPRPDQDMLYWRLRLDGRRFCNEPVIDRLGLRIFADENACAIDIGIDHEKPGMGFSQCL